MSLQSCRLSSLKDAVAYYYGCYFLLVVARHITCCYNSLTKTSSSLGKGKLCLLYVYGLFSNLRLHPQQFDGNYEECCELKSTAGSANPQQLFSDQLNTFVLQQMIMAFAVVHSRLKSGANMEWFAATLDLHFMSYAQCVRASINRVSK